MSTKPFISLLKLVFGILIGLACIFAQTKVMGPRDYPLQNCSAAPAAGLLRQCADMATGNLLCINSAGGSCSGTATITIASGTTAATGPGSINNLGSIAAGSCATLAIVATGTATTDTIVVTPNGSIKALTGFVPATTGGLTIAAFPTANNVNFDLCNWTAGAITPGNAQLNWRVSR